MVVPTHGPVAAGWHVHGATGHVGGLVGPRPLHGHVVRAWRDKSRWIIEILALERTVCGHNSNRGFIRLPIVPAGPLAENNNIALMFKHQ